jgi:hypothetical protein
MGTADLCRSVRVSETLPKRASVSPASLRPQGLESESGSNVVKLDMLDSLTIGDSTSIKAHDCYIIGHKILQMFSPKNIRIYRKRSIGTSKVQDHNKNEDSL